MAEAFEVGMLVCFGLSWPISVAKSIKSQTAKGKSILFSYIIVVGYVFGILSKLAADKLSYVLALYVLNLAIVWIDILLYYRNKKLDKIREREGL